MLYMETTQIDLQQTVAEIQKILSLHGAMAIRLEYENAEITAVFFVIRLNGREIPFQLPCRWEPIFQHLQKKRQHRWRKEKEDRAQAKRVAWGQILRWVDAQLALVNTGMTQIEEVFLPYIQVGMKETLYEQIKRTGFQIEYKPAGKTKEEIINVE